MLGVITREYNDILRVLETNFISYEVISSGFQHLNEYQALLILGGTEIEPLKLSMSERRQVEKFMASKKKVFAEYMTGIGAISIENYQLSRFERVAYVGKDVCKTLQPLDIIDNQCTYRLKPFHEVLKTREPLMVFTSEHVHKQLEEVEKNYDIGQYALFFERTNVLYGSFQLANFHRNRYAPRKKVQDLVANILTWLIDRPVSTDGLAPIYTLEKAKPKDLYSQNKATAELAVRWFEDSETLITQGVAGVHEGYGTEIYTDGKQRKALNVRGDCVGEAGMLHYLAGKVLSNEKYTKISEMLFQFGIDEFIIKEGEYQGFVRWSDASYESSYGDDMARMMFPYLLKDLLEEESNYQEVIEKILNHHIQTTGKDGLRRSRFEIEELTETYKQKVREETDSLASAHYNAYYHGCLIFAFLLYGKEEYLEVGKKGMDTLLKKYPYTTREQSQTQEEARFILPLALLYLATEEEVYEKALIQIIEDLDKRRHVAGCYMEWDEGYQASMRNTEGDGECSLLSKNGDTIVDLLYTNNWLPIGFIMAYIATANADDLEKYEAICEFFISTQMHSSQKELNGAWARGYDPELQEYFGSPADMGWGPYCIESGWTVAEIGSGLLLGCIAEEVKEKVDRRKRELEGS